jgi:GTP-binding protein
MADGVCLLVDAFEGPMPQTRFVLQKAIDLGLKPCVSIKLIKKTVLLKKFMKGFDLMFELGAEEWQLDFQFMVLLKITGCLTIGKT